MPRLRTPKPADIPEAVLNHFAGRFTGFDDTILARYARGLTVREIQAFLVEMYAGEANYWRSAHNQFAIVYGERFTAPGAQ